MCEGWEIDMSLAFFVEGDVLVLIIAIVMQYALESSSGERTHKQ